MGDYFKKLAGDPTWDDDAGGSQMPCYATIAARDVGYPSPSLGQTVKIARLYGGGYFSQFYNGTRWEVCLGECVIDDYGVDGAGYAITGVSGLISIASVTIPGGLIGSPEKWEPFMYGQSIYGSSNNVPNIRIAGNDAVLARGIFSNATSAQIFTNFMNLSDGSVLSNQTVSVDFQGNTATAYTFQLSQSQTISAGVTVGNVGNNIKVRNWGLRRVA